MNKKQLLELLKPMPDDTIIILASDEEQNDFGVCTKVFSLTGESGALLAILVPASNTVNAVVDDDPQDVILEVREV